VKSGRIWALRAHGPWEKRGRCAAWGASLGRHLLASAAGGRCFHRRQHDRLTIGSGPNPVVMDLCKQIGVEAAKGRVPTDAFMHVAGMDTLWAAGDGASVPWNDRVRPRSRLPRRSSH